MVVKSTGILGVFGSSRRDESNGRCFASKPTGILTIYIFYSQKIIFKKEKAFKKLTKKKLKNY